MERDSRFLDTAARERILALLTEAAKTDGAASQDLREFLRWERVVDTLRADVRFWEREAKGADLDPVCDECHDSTDGEIVCRECHDEIVKNARERKEVASV